MATGNKVTISVCGKEYTLSTMETQGYVLDLAKKLDTMVEKMLLNAENISTNTALVLTAISLLDDYIKAMENVESVRGQIREYVDECAAARAETNEAKGEVEHFKREIASLKNDIELLRLKAKL